MSDFLPAEERTKPMMMPCVICKQEKMCWIICDDCWKLIDQGIYVQCPICLCFVHKEEECKHENLKYRNIDYSNVGNGTCENPSHQQTPNKKIEENRGYKDHFTEETSDSPRCKKCGRVLNTYEKNQGWHYCKKCGLENYIQLNT